LSKGKTDKSNRHKDGPGHHHPMGVFPIEQKVQHLAIAPSLVISPSPSAGRLACFILVLTQIPVLFFCNVRTVKHIAPPFRNHRPKQQETRKAARSPK
jgi:hypothetical protein